MLRHAFAMEVKEGRTAEFRSNLGKVWAELTAFLDEKKMVNFSMWNVLDYGVKSGEHIYGAQISDFYSRNQIFPIPQQKRKEK